MKLSAPTSEQINKINQFAKGTLEAEGVYVFKDLMIDNLETDYAFEIHPNLLQKFCQDVLVGIPLQTNHNSRQLPTGRSFDASLVQEYDSDLGQFVTSLYGDFYIDLGRNLESGISTDDVVKGIESGVISDTSIGFNAKTWACNICGNDVRTWDCAHVPGRSYVVEHDGQEEVMRCKAVVGEDGRGELVENSLVYAGGSPRASIVQNLNKDVTNSENGSKLRLINDLKKVSLDATIYQVKTKEGVLMLISEDKYDLSESTRGSEDAVDFYKETLNKLGINAETPEELSATIEGLLAKEGEVGKSQETVEGLKADLAAKDTELEDVKVQLTTKEAEMLEMTNTNAELTEKVESLTKENEGLLAKADLAETYRKDLIDQVLETGVRAYGNGFNTELFTKFTATLSVDELKETLAGFTKDVEAKFEGVRVSQAEKTEEAGLSSKDSFESEVEFRAYVAEQALSYAKENNVSVSEATRLLYKQLSEKDGSEN